MSFISEQVYSAQNCKFAYDLNWGVWVFWNDQVVKEHQVYLDLAQRLRVDGIRLKGYRLDKNASVFVVTTQPETAPVKIVQRIKGRLQYLVRESMPAAFQKKYAIRGFGEANRENVERYISTQLDHHLMADSRVQESLQGLQIDQSHVDLSESRKTSGGVYWNNLHLVLVHRDRWKDISEARLRRLRDALLSQSQPRNYWISRGGILCDHLHLALSAPVDDSPQTVAIHYLNECAKIYENRPVFQFGAYVGTFGEYTWGAIETTNID